VKNDSLDHLPICTFLWRRWKKRHPVNVPQIVIHPLDRIRDKVSSMVPEEPFAEKVQEDYFYELSLTLREFVEELLKIPATDRTLKELRDPLRRSLPLAAERISDLLQFLDRADMVKFAKAPATIQEARRCHDDVKLWIAHMMPRNLGVDTPSSNPGGEVSTSIREVPHRV
jgi:hypothetical protein